MDYSNAVLPKIQFQHATPLLRHLSGLELQLQYNKVKNLQLACPKVNGIILHPGETFSYWKTIGKPTVWKGYLPGMVLVNEKVTAGIGGGLCQLSNRICWMTPRIRGEYWGGFTRHNELWRRESDSDGNYLREEFIAENHVLMMYEPFLDCKSTLSGILN